MPNFWIWIRIFLLRTCLQSQFHVAVAKSTFHSRSPMVSTQCSAGGFSRTRSRRAADNGAQGWRCLQHGKSRRQERPESQVTQSLNSCAGLDHLQVQMGAGIRTTSAMRIGASLKRIGVDEIKNDQVCNPRCCWEPPIQDIQKLDAKNC